MTTSLHGVSAPWSTDAERRAAIEQAFDYRGDVTLRSVAGETVVGYVSNRELDVPEPFVDVWTAGAAKPRRVPLAEIAGLTFTGVDPAAGKSWETWLAKVAEAEAAGKIAELYPDEDEA
jgi:hypothetical protein